MRLIVPLLTIAALGCGTPADPAGACDDYVSAYNACINEFGGPDNIDSSFCLFYNGLSGSDARDAEAALDCATSGIELVDCSVDVSAELATMLTTCDS